METDNITKKSINKSSDYNDSNIDSDGDNWVEDESSPKEVLMDHDLDYDTDGAVIVGEQLFYDLCEAWLDRKGPSLFKFFLASKEKKEAEVELKSETGKKQGVVRKPIFGKSKKGNLLV